MGGGGHDDHGDHGDHGPVIPAIFYKMDPANDVTMALPKAQDLGGVFGTYGNRPGSRPKVGTFIFNRANGGRTAFGPMYYNLFNMMRLSIIGKYFAFLPVPYIVWGVYQTQRGVGAEYDLDIENYAPFEAKKNPSHGH